MRREALSARASNSAVGDVGDDTHRKRCVHGQDFFSVDANLALTRHDWPVDLVVVLPSLDFCDVRYFVRLILNRQVLGPANDCARWNSGMDLDRDAQPTINGERIIVILYNSGSSQLVFALAAVGRRVIAEKRTGVVRQNLGGD